MNYKKYNVFFKIPSFLYFALIALSLWALFTPNPLLTIFAIWLLPVFASLLWRQGDPPILLFAVMFQWLQVNIALFYANIIGQPFATLLDFTAPLIEKASWLSLIGLLVLTLGMRMGMGKTTFNKQVAITREVASLSAVKLFRFYFIYSIILSILVIIMPSGARQVIVVLLSFKFAILFLLGYVVFSTKKNYALFFLLCGVEFFLALGGFFSEFKTVFYIIFLVILTFSTTLKLKNIITLGLTALIVLYLGTVWTAIKMDYRNIANLGTGEQVVALSYAERLDSLRTLASTLSQEEYAEAIKNLIGRIQYTYFFAQVLAYVPKHQSHTNGDLLWATLLHIVTPRILFPDKPPLVLDTVITEKYTGLYLGSEKGTTSISIGYMGEIYIDFGYPFKFIVIFGLGVFFGLIYQSFTEKRRDILVGYSLAVVCLLNAATFETTFIKTVGGTLTAFIVSMVAYYIYSKTPFLRRLIQK